MARVAKKDKEKQSKLKEKMKAKKLKERQKAKAAKEKAAAPKAKRGRKPRAEKAAKPAKAAPKARKGTSINLGYTMNSSMENVVAVAQDGDDILLTLADGSVKKLTNATFSLNIQV